MTFIKLVSEKVENASMPAGPINKWVKTKNSGCKWDISFTICPWWKITKTIPFDTEIIGFGHHTIKVRKNVL